MLFRSLRDWCIEYVRNAFSHGGATTAKVEVTKVSIVIEDDGALFNPWFFSEPNVGRGGAEAFCNLIFGSEPVVCSYQREGDRNRLILARTDTIEDIELTEVASVVFSHPELVDVDNSIAKKVAALGDVSPIYLVCKSYMAISDIDFLENIIAASNDKDFVLVLESSAASSFVIDKLSKLAQCRSVIVL